MKDIQEQLRLANLRISELEAERESAGMHIPGGPSNILDPGPSSSVAAQRMIFPGSVPEEEPGLEKLGALGVGDYGQTLFHSGSTAGGSEVRLRALSHLKQIC